MKCPFCIKICTKCKRILVANKINFGKYKNGKYGLKAICKQCRKRCYEDNKEEILEKSKQYYKNNRETILERCKQHYEDNKEEVLEYHKKYYKDNREVILGKCKQYYNDNKEEVLEYHKKYYDDNPHIRFNNHIRRRQLEEQQGNGITKEQWLEMMQFFDWKCAYSGEYIGNNSEYRTIDHIISLSNGGLNEPWNCVPMLRNLNSSKYTSNMEDWYIEQDFFDIDRLLKIYEWIEYSYKKWGGVNND